MHTRRKLSGNKKEMSKGKEARGKHSVTHGEEPKTLHFSFLLSHSFLFLFSQLWNAYYMSS